MNNLKRISTVSVNMKKNRLYISLQGIISKKEVERLYTDIRFCVNDLGPGFTVITDLTHCRIGHLSGVGTYKKIMNYLIEKQVGQIVRVVGQARVIYLQMLKLSDKLQNYKPEYVATLEEAEELMNEQLARSKSAA